MNTLTLDIWMALWSRLAPTVDSKAVMTEYIGLCAQFTEPHRVPHAFAHTEQRLVEWQRVCSRFKYPDAALLALWYHDAIHNPKAKNNAEKNVALMREICKRFEQPKEFSEKVARHIMATQYPPTLLDEDIPLFIDITTNAPDH